MPGVLVAEEHDASDAEQTRRPRLTLALVGQARRRRRGVVDGRRDAAALAARSRHDDDDPMARVGEPRDGAAGEDRLVVWVRVEEHDRLPLAGTPGLPTWSSRDP